jgi:para-aminobenzoate synthetase component 1
MAPLLEQCDTVHTPESLVEALGAESGTILLRSDPNDGARARFSFVAARPFLTFRAYGSRCETESGGERQTQFGNPWHLLEPLLARYELVDGVDLPFPMGGCFGFWGYDLKRFVEPRLPARAHRDLDVPDCYLGFYASLVVFDHVLGTRWIISTGLTLDGARQENKARADLEFWQHHLRAGPVAWEGDSQTHSASPPPVVHAETTRAEFIENVERAQRYIRAGDIYQVNLSQRFAAHLRSSSWQLFRDLRDVSPAPFAAYLDGGEFQIISSSPELFLRLSGRHVLTRPIKGTRPRSPDPTRDAQLAFELQSSPKELAELVMITDLLRNDLGKVCEFGSVQVPELVCLERYAQVQHLVSTVEGRLRGPATYLGALAACFPGGSITGAPKIRAMEIIDELEPTTRGPYTGALGYLGFNRESQLSILIRTALCLHGTAYFHAGAGIVADSLPEAEYAETLAKARGFFKAVERGSGAARSRTSQTSLSPE